MSGDRNVTIGQDAFGNVIITGDNNVAVVLQGADRILDDLNEIKNVVRDLSKATSSSKFEGKIRTFFEEYLVAEVATEPLPFGGRTDELQILHDWISNPAAPPRFVMAGPAGRGKSALLVHWLERLQRESQIVGQDRKLNVIFIPISIRFGINRPEVIYEALATRLAELLEAELRVPHMNPADFYEDRCRILIDDAVERQVPILIVIDGADEILGGSFDPRWFPRAPGTALRLLISARGQLAAEDAHGWVGRLGWASAGLRVQMYNLPKLNYHGLRDVLLRSEVPVGVLGSHEGVIQRLYELADGEPLVLRLYIEDLRLHGGSAAQLTLDDLDKLEPGIHSYFSDWFRRQRLAWRVERQEGAEINETLVLAHLGVLACAHGPLTALELSRVVDRIVVRPPLLRVDDVLEPIRRFVINTGQNGVGAGYVLGHSKFGEFFRGYLDPQSIASTRSAFADWGNEVILALCRGDMAPTDVPIYILQCFRLHLAEASASLDEYRQLVEYPWLSAWYALEGGYRGFSEDVEDAHRVACTASDMPVAWTFQIRCQLVLSSIASRGASIVGGQLRTYLDVGEITPNQFLERLSYRPAGDIAVTLATAVINLPDATIPRALEIALGLTEPAYRAWAIACLLSRLSDPERTFALNQAVQAAKVTRGPVEWQIKALAGVAFQAEEHVSRPLMVDAINKALSLRKWEIRNDGHYIMGRGFMPYWEWGWPLSLLLKEIPETMCSLAITTIGAYPDDAIRAEAITYLADRITPDLHDGIISMIQTFGDPALRAKCIAEVAPYVPDRLISLVLHSVRRGPGRRVDALVALAPRLKNPIRKDLLGEILKILAKVDDPSDYLQKEILSKIATLLPEELFEAAVYMASRMKVEGNRYGALDALIPHLPQRLIHRVLAITRDFRDGSNRGRLLASIVPRLTPGRQAAVILEAVASGRASVRGSGGDLDYYQVLSRLAAKAPLGQLNHVLRAAPELSGSLRGHLLATLVERQVGLVEPILEMVEHIDEPKARSRTFLEIAGHLEEGDTKQAALVACLECAKQIEDEREKAVILTALAACVSIEKLSDIVECGRRFRFRFLGSEVQAVAARSLSQGRSDLWGEALALDEAVGDERSRAEILAALIPYLETDNRRVAVESGFAAARVAQTRYDDRANALAAMFPHAPLEEQGKIAAEALTTAPVEVIRRIATNVPEGVREPILPKLLEAARGKGEFWTDVCDIVSIIPLFPIAEREGVLQQALSAMRLAEAKDSSPSYRNVEVEVLIQIAQHLPRGDADLLRQRALELAWSLWGEEGYKAAAAIAPHLFDTQRDQLVAHAIEEARQYYEESSEHLATALIALSPFLPTQDRVAVLREALAGWNPTLEKDNEEAEPFVSLSRQLVELSMTDSLFEVIRKAGKFKRGPYLDVIRGLLPFVAGAEGDLAAGEILELFWTLPSGFHKARITTLVGLLAI